MDIAIVRTGDQDDIELTNGEMRLVTDQAAIGQDIKMRLQMWLGESVYDEEAGIPYIQVVFGVRRIIEGVGYFFHDAIAKTPGVLEVLELDLDLDNATRILTCTGRARTIEGDVDFGSLVNGGA